MAFHNPIGLGSIIIGYIIESKSIFHNNGSIFSASQTIPFFWEIVLVQYFVHLFISQKCLYILPHICRSTIPNVNSTSQQALTYKTHELLHYYWKSQMFSSNSLFWHTGVATAIFDRNNEKRIQQKWMARCCYEILHPMSSFPQAGLFLPDWYILHIFTKSNSIN